MTSSGNPHTFQSDRAKAVIARLEVFLEGRGGATTAEMVAFSGLSETQTKLYINYMLETGAIHCSKPFVKGRRGGTAAVFSTGPGRGEFENQQADLQQNVIVRKTWEPNHVRMALECYLFGVPAVLSK